MRNVVVNDPLKTHAPGYEVDAEYWPQVFNPDDPDVPDSEKRKPMYFRVITLRGYFLTDPSNPREVIGAHGAVTLNGETFPGEGTVVSVLAPHIGLPTFSIRIVPDMAVYDHDQCWRLFNTLGGSGWTLSIASATICPA